MKILIATPIYLPEIGGPATYIKELCARINNKHDITVVAYSDFGVAFPGIKLVKVTKHAPLLQRLIKYFLSLWKTSKDTEVMYVQNAMAAGLPAALVCVIRKIPFIVKIVGDEAWERATQHRLTNKNWEEFLEKPEGGLQIKIMMKIQKWVLGRAKIVTTPSLYMSKEIIKSYGVLPEKIRVNYNAVEETEVSPFKVEPIPHQIVTTARLIHLKRIDDTIRALSILKIKYPDTSLVIGGDGPELENLKQLTHKLNLENDVIFLGKISRAETWQIRKQSSVYVLISTHEGLPITLLTSLAAKIPIVATNISGTNEVVYHEKTGLLIGVGDTEALAKAIERLFEDEKLRNILIQNGLQLLKEKFSWETHLKILENMFMSAIN
ncbi:MAG: glycosyl transferase, group 1 [Parcubacteria group bacterium Athens0714_16]|nr:MAG: glycosyl transferase, group 1 [Parcubacteria group bacterium Athens0714_16]